MVRGSDDGQLFVVVKNKTRIFIYQLEILWASKLSFFLAGAAVGYVFTARAHDYLVSALIASKH